MNSFLRLYLKILLVMIAVSPAAVMAQDNENQDKDTTVVKTKEIVVTATKYPERLLEVPLSITVIQSQQFMNKKGFGLDDALNMTPGVLAQSRFGNQDIRITIRGFGARGAGDRSNAGTSRGIKVFLDGVPETEPDGRTAFDNIDVTMAQKIEVIRSNASSLWGNAAGGVVSISTMPVFSDPFVRLSSQAGSYDYQKYLIEAGTPLGGGKLSASFSSTFFGGYRENSGSERYLANIGIMAPMSGSTLLGINMLAVSNRFFIPGPLTKEQFDSNPVMANPEYLNRKEHRFNRQGRIGITLEHNFDDMNNISFMSYVNPKYLQRSERNTFRDFTRYHAGGSLSFRNSFLITDNIRNTGLIGIDESYQDGAILFYKLSPSMGRSDTLTQNKAEGANSFGAYIQDEFSIIDVMSVVIGARYDNVTYYSQNFMDNRLNQKKEFSRISPKIGLTYMLSSNNSIYANYGEGIEVPAGNETDPTPGLDTIYSLNPLLDPIISRTYEIGSKNFIELEDNFALSLDAALYMINVTNDIIPYRGGRFYFTAGESRRTGAELGISLYMDYGISFSSAVTYSYNEYIDYKVDSSHFKPGAGISDYGGNKAAGIPNFYYSAALRIAPEDMYGLFAEIGVQGVNKYFADDANTFEVPAYNVVNVSAGLTEPFKVTDAIGIRAFAAVNNLLDKKYAASAFINPDPDKTTGKPTFLEPGLPRNFVVGLSVVFR